MAKNKEVKVKKKWQELVSKITGGILFGLVAILIVFQFVGIFTASANGGVPNYGGFMSFRVVTDSMEQGNKFTVNTMVFIQKVDVNELKVGDVITFKRNDHAAYGDNAASPKVVVTHRITDIETYNGAPAFRTLGDNLNSQSCLNGPCTIANRDYVQGKDVFGKVVGESKALGVLNKVMIEQPLVMAGLVLIPLLVVFSSSLVDLIKQLKNHEKEEVVESSEGGVVNPFAALNEEDKLKLLVEIEKEKMRQAALKDVGSSLSPTSANKETDFEALKQQEKMRLLIEMEKEKLRREANGEVEKEATVNDIKNSNNDLEVLKQQEKLKLMIEIEKEKMRREMEEEHEKAKKS